MTGTFSLPPLAFETLSLCTHALFTHTATRFVVTSGTFQPLSCTLFTVYLCVDTLAGKPNQRTFPVDPCSRSRTQATENRHAPFIQILKEADVLKIK